MARLGIIDDILQSLWPGYSIQDVRKTLSGSLLNTVATKIIYSTSGIVSWA